MGRSTNTAIVESIEASDETEYEFNGDSVNWASKGKVFAVKN